MKRSLSPLLMAMSLCLLLTTSCDGNSPGVGNGDGGGGTGGNGGGGGGSGGNGGGGGDTGDGGWLGDAGVPPAGCVAGGPECNNCIDDDRDGKTDYQDGECVSPLDNDESSYATGIPGDNMDACKQDCFFDGDSGMGNDGCEWNLKCDPKSPGATAAKACPYDKDYKNCPTTVSDRCRKFCRNITPNGCDCFGCCQVTYKSSGGMDVTESIYLAPTCTVAKFSDPVACPRCTQHMDCVNPCDKCEVCIGKPVVPEDCPRPDGGVPGYDGGVPDGGGPGYDGGGPPPPPPPSCPSGVIACGAGGIDPSTCPTGTVCITGCCINWVP